MRYPLMLLFTLMVMAAQAQTLNLPPRSPDALSGSAFVTAITDLEREARELRIYQEIMAGNIPDFMRQLVPVTVTENIGGQNRTAVYYVAPDYMAVGSNDDYFLCPMTPILAQWLVDATDCTLPTRKMVNDIWAAGPQGARFQPQPIPPSPEMTTVPIFDQHNSMVWAQRSPVLPTYPLGTLIGGTKKDVVITPRLATTPDKVAIYGWHYTNGDNIQPLYLGHVDWYVDYSHGIRFVQNAMTVDGNATTVQAVLGDAVLNPLLSDEGPFTQMGYDVPPAPVVEEFPFQDDFPAQGRELQSWIDRFKTPTITSTNPLSPGGDGFGLLVRDTSGGIDTTRIDPAGIADYTVSCDILCDYRPEDSANGFERLGIFVRDDGNGLFTGTSGGGVPGNNYALTWDSHTGRVQCIKTVNGTPGDLLPAARFEASTAWRHFEITAQGSTITFRLDGETLLSVNDATHTSGAFGIGYQEQFATNTNIQGTLADNFLAVMAADLPVGHSLN